MKKTTIAIAMDSRKKLGKIKSVLQDQKGGRFVDMDEVILYLLDNAPIKMKAEFE
jgi:hypothetical protein